MITINSAQNDTFKKILSLTTSKGLKKEGLFLLCGKNLIKEFLKNPHLKIHYELLTAKMPSVLNDPSLTVQLSPELFDLVDVVGTSHPMLVVEQPAMGKLSIAELSTYQPQGIELVVPTGDPGNLGAVLRSCEAFGVRHVHVTEEAANPFLPKSVKASAGSVLRVPMARGPALAQYPRTCIALAADGEAINQFKWPKNGLLVVGEEGKGLGEGKFKHRLRIPTEGVESLNAVVAASIALAFHRLVRTLYPIHE